MTIAAKPKQGERVHSPRVMNDLSSYVPERLRKLDNPQTAIPRIAKDADSVEEIEHAVKSLRTTHRLYQGDPRNLAQLPSDSVHLVLPHRRIGH